MAQFLSHPWMPTLLLSIAFVSIVVELFAPKFTGLIFVGIAAFILYFYAHFQTGQAGWFHVICFVLGFILLIAEVFIPGFGLPGIAGIIFLLLGLTLAQGELIDGLFSISVAATLAFMVGIALTKIGYRSRFINRVVLEAALNAEEGVQSGLDFDFLKGKEGQALSALRPSGKIVIDGEVYDAVSPGNFIEKGSLIIVRQVNGSKLTVQTVEE